MRPNLAMDPPPRSIVLRGAAYPADTDYRTWLRVLGLLKELPRDGRKLAEIETLVFGGIPVDEEPEEVLRGVLGFARGYPCAVTGGGSGPRVLDLELDINELILAIRNQSGIDLSWRRREPFHWWEFLLEARTLCGDHTILRLMEARGYEGRDPELLRRKRRAALPPEPADGELLAALDGELYGS